MCIRDRAVRELLINVAKHARADSAFVESECRDERIVVRVSDSGIGYDPAAVVSGPHRGLGLISVRERLPLIGGVAELSSAPGRGTVSVLSVPIASDEALQAERDA